MLILVPDGESSWIAEGAFQTWSSRRFYTKCASACHRTIYIWSRSADGRLTCGNNSSTYSVKSQFPLGMIFLRIATEGKFLCVANTTRSKLIAFIRRNFFIRSNPEDSCPRWKRLKYSLWYREKKVWNSDTKNRMGKWGRGQTLIK